MIRVIVRYFLLLPVHLPNYEPEHCFYSFLLIKYIYGSVVGKKKCSSNDDHRDEEKDGGEMGRMGLLIMISTLT
jgi:hypothetical protein